MSFWSSGNSPGLAAESFSGDDASFVDAGRREERHPRANSYSRRRGNVTTGSLLIRRGAEGEAGVIDRGNISIREYENTRDGQRPSRFGIVEGVRDLPRVLTFLARNAGEDA